MKLKTINVTKREFEHSLFQLINNSNIPACILQDIFELILNQLKKLADADYERDIKQLEKEQEQQEQEQENESSQN